MKRSTRNLILAAFALAAATCAVWFWQRQGHSQKHEKLSGETSFDIYADSGSVHMLLLKEHGQHQSIVYRRITHGEVAHEIALPVNPREKIISRRSNDVQIAAAGKHLLAAWQISGTGYAHRGPVRTAESQDGGITWQQAAPPAAANRTDDQGFFDIETDSRGRFHLVWLDSLSKIKGLRHASYTSGKWSIATTIDAETCQCCWNSLRKNPQGDLLVLYRNARPRDMALARFDGLRWQKTGIVDGFGWKVEICPHAGGGIAADREQTYAVTWTGLEAQTGCHLTQRLNSAASWQKPQRFGNVSARNPDIAINGAELAVVWDEFEGDRRLARFMRLPKTQLQKFPAAQNLSAAAAASYPRVVADGAGFQVFWSETKNGEAVIRGRKL